MQIIADSRRNEMYFAKQFTPSKSGGTQGWVDAVIEQVGSVSTAADLLNKLLSNNAVLLDKNVNKKTFPF